MAESPVVNEVEALRNQRLQIRKAVQHTKSVSAQLDSLAGEIPACSSRAVAPLRTPPEPPAELAAALEFVQRGIAKVGSLNASIQQKQDEIERLKKRDLTILAVLAGAIVLGAMILISILSR